MKFDKNDLKIGYIVQFSSLNYGMVMQVNEKEKVIAYNNGTYINLNDIADDLLEINGRGNYDIIKVFGFTKNSYSPLELSGKNREILWQREEIKPLSSKPKVAEYLGLEIGEEYHIENSSFNPFQVNNRYELVSNSDFELDAYSLLQLINHPERIKKFKEVYYVI